jgi:hypothetical protein
MLTKVTSLGKVGCRSAARHLFKDGSGGVHDFTAMVHEPGA